MEAIGFGIFALRVDQGLLKGTPVLHEPSYAIREIERGTKRSLRLGAVDQPSLRRYQFDFTYFLGVSPD
jgi:hypothetical protein